MFENSTNFINSNTDLVYIHYDYPHTFKDKRINNSR